MIGNNGSNSPGKINIVVLTKYVLVHSYLKLLFQTKNRSINTVSFVKSTDELLDLVSDKKFDVILFCLMENEMENIEVIPDLLKAAPDSKILVLMSSSDVVDQTKLLKSGVAGIVGFEQKEEVLIRAIQQVAEGGVWLNQKIIAQLLGNGTNPKNDDLKNKVPFANDPLTPRELDVIGEIAKGFTNKEISNQLFISEATVRHHLGSIYGKLQVEDRLNLVIYALRHGIVEHSQ